MSDIEPLRLFEYDHDPGNYCLMLSDDHMVGVMEVFDEVGHYGNGYNWEAVARQALRAHAPEYVGMLDYDPEAGTFVAYGTNREALQRLGELLAKAYHEREFLEQLLRDAEDDWFDD
jgi:hypothetical protein